MKFMFYCGFVAVMLCVSATFSPQGNYRALSSVGEPSVTKITGLDFAKY